MWNLNSTDIYSFPNTLTEYGSGGMHISWWNMEEVKDITALKHLLTGFRE